MVGKALYILAGYDDRTEVILSGIQHSLYDLGFSGTQTKNIPMHITLGSFPVDQEDNLKDLLKQIAEKANSFSITFNHVGIFGGDKQHVLFIGPDVVTELLALKESFNDSRNWTAHTTMLIDTPEVIHTAIPAVMKEFVPFEGKVTTLHLYEFWPTRHILTVQLAHP